MKPPEEAGEADGSVVRRPPKPSQCTQYVQSRVARDLPAIVDALLKKSRKGDAATLKSLWQMGQLDRQLVAAKKRKSGVARELLERFGKK